MQQPTIKPICVKDHAYESDNFLYKKKSQHFSWNYVFRCCISGIGARSVVSAECAGI